MAAWLTRGENKIGRFRERLILVNEMFDGTNPLGINLFSNFPWSLHSISPENYAKIY